jgi:hypothetical protein
MTEATISMWLAAPAVSIVMDMKGNIVVVVVIAIELCDWLPWMEARPETHLIFYSFFWLSGGWKNLFSYDLYHSHDTCNIVACLSFICDCPRLVRPPVWLCRPFLVLKLRCL